MKTRLTELFKIKHPIMLAGMNWITTPKIVAAVSNAGGLGNLAASGRTPEELRRDIRIIRELTDKPFSVNQILISPTAKANLEVMFAEKVPIVNYTLGRPPDITPVVKKVHGYGGKVIATVALVRHAMRAEQLGADAINITGHEAAAHGGYATSMVLIPLVASAVKVPITAAGGFFDGRGLAAALVLGADGITMGTRFAMTKEGALHEHWQRKIMESSEQDTIYVDTGNPALNERVLKTRKAESEAKHGTSFGESITGIIETKKLLKLSWWELIRSGVTSSKGEGGLNLKEKMKYAAESARADQVIFGGDENAGTLPIGQAIGGIRDLPGCEELINRIIAQAEQVIAAAYKNTNLK